MCWTNNLESVKKTIKSWLYKCATVEEDDNFPKILQKCSFMIITGIKMGVVDIICGKTGGSLGLELW